MVSHGDGDASGTREQTSNLLMSSTRQILDVSHKNLLSCCTKPILIEMNLVDGPTFEPSKKFEAGLNFISGGFKQV